MPVSSLKYIIIVMAKSYQLMAWTDNGQVKMVPSLVAELAKPYIRIIQEASNEPRAFGINEETAQLLRHSRTHEALARFFLRVGYWEDAFLQYYEAAIVVTNCSDLLWADSDYGFLLHTPLRRRFWEMYDHCRRLAYDHPVIKDSIQWQNLQTEWSVVTNVYRIRDARPG